MQVVSYNQWNKIFKCYLLLLLDISFTGETELQVTFDLLLSLLDTFCDLLRLLERFSLTDESTVSLEPVKVCIKSHPCGIKTVIQVGRHVVSTDVKSIGSIFT